MEPVHKEMLLESLDKYHHCEVVVGGTSMWPFIQSGDTVGIVQKGLRPTLGSIVAFFEGSQLIVHRIIWLKQMGDDTCDLFVQGDASPFSLARIESDQIVGTVQYVKRNNKKITLLFTMPYQMFAIPVGMIVQFLVAIKLGLYFKKA